MITTYSEAMSEAITAAHAASSTEYPERSKAHSRRGTLWLKIAEEIRKKDGAESRA